MRMLSGASRVAACWSLLAVLVAVLLFAAGCRHKKVAAPEAAPGQKTFVSAADAGRALVDAAQGNNQQAVLEIFGPNSKELIFSGDAEDDKAELTGFAEAYQQMNRWRTLENGNQILLVGVTNTEFPVPLAKNSKGQWFFDTPAGATELSVRRIGRNELAVIDIMAALADAQQAYYNQAHDGTKQYARKFISDAGKEDGLYWPDSAGKAKSPVGPLLAYATEQGARLNYKLHKPFHGYYYSILVTQSLWANGGLKDYVRSGLMTRGFGFIAWPAEYGKSGVHTFIINADRLVLQKDMEAKTAAEAPFITQFNPDGFVRVEQ